MTAVHGFPLMLNQDVPEGYGYPAEAFRAEHYDATSAGNGVGSPTALKVSALPAPDRTIRTNPGGATLRSTYAGHVGQSYHAYFGGPRTVPVSPTGSSAGGRTDLVVVQLCDPEHDEHWSYEGEYPIPADVAKDMEFQRIHVFEGQDRTAHLDFPHALLAEISRPPNTTVVTDEHITDLRRLANPQSDRFVESFHPSGVTDITGHNYHTVGTLFVPVPDFATVAKVRADFGGIAVIQGGWVSGQVNGLFPGLALHPTWYRGHAYSSQQSGSVSSFIAETIQVPQDWRGTVQRFDFRVRRESGVDSGLARTDSGTTLALDVTFQQGVA